MSPVKPGRFILPIFIFYDAIINSRKYKLDITPTFAYDHSNKPFKIADLPEKIHSYQKLKESFRKSSENVERIKTVHFLE